ncbi:DUF1810 domain-containing protein [Sphingomonas sp. AR_OL41]|uniref:DUF1810 domain-containing protein n=1 Tax=Sphingomonas sp. AR_OL41 TaxID=3042729 RepID=UPI0024818A9C|nr:DUF1810 domain-containing protein [Sphingomonas sp. AR_OL41]MDH7975070.1 DUF1810 domain-containing protein [Sphingomonas sp. AR_OL41]
MADRFDLNRFVAAQAGSYDRALAELSAGQKRSHWMWFVFPQFAGLGSSPMAQRYAISSLDEARAYLDHPLLGPRYAACVAALAALPPDATARGVFGDVDAMKLCSSLTLFAAVRSSASLDAAIVRWCSAPDARTLALLGMA